MPQTRSCEYCGDDIEPGTGTMLVRTNGSTIHYCSSKCEKNAALGREPRDLEWTEAGGGDRDRVVEEPDEASAEAEAVEADTESVDGSDATEDVDDTEAEDADADEAGEAESEDADADEAEDADADEAEATEDDGEDGAEA